MEHHHPIMSTLVDPRGRLERDRKNKFPFLFKKYKLVPRRGPIIRNVLKKDIN